MQTRCPACQTTFRVTPDQLNAKAGRVRCGQCQHVFNALDHLEADPNAETIVIDMADLPALAAQAAPASPSPEPLSPPESSEAPLPLGDLALDAPTRLPAELDDAAFVLPEAIPQPPAATPPEQAWDPAGETVLAPGPGWDPAGETVLVPRNDPDPAAETVLVPRADKGSPEPLPVEPVSTPISTTPALEASTGAEVDAATEADDRAKDETGTAAASAPSDEPPATDGADEPAPPPLTALTPAATLDPHDPILARDHTEIPGYSKWAQAPLAGGIGTGGIGAGAHRPTWLFTLAATILALVLAGQAALYWRTELSTAAPFLRGVFAALGVNVPLPRVTEKVSLEASDLQSDANRGLLVLQATLRNRAAFAQAYPSLDLALTDVGDSVVLRRTLAPADYLPEGAAPTFAPGSDLALKVWLDIKPLEAAGYRLVVFYP